jgi:hypothetical protein
VLVDWRTPAQSIRTQRKVYCFKDRGFARVIVADEDGMVRKDQLCRTDAPEIFDRYGVDLQVGPWRNSVLFFPLSSYRQFNPTSPEIAAKALQKWTMGGFKM